LLLLSFRKILVEDPHHIGIFVVAATFRNALVVFTGEHTSSKRRPDSGSKLALLKESSVLDLHVVSFEDVVLGLLDDRLNEVILFADIDSLSNLVLAPFTGSPVEGPALADDPVESPADLLHGHSVIASVAENNINVVILQSSKRVLQAFDDVFPGETFSGGNGSDGAEEDFG
jgi:hypothetical protein